MKQDEITHFPQEVKDKLIYYVYRLIDPRNGETFYVGKGKDDRIFSHIRLEGDLENDEQDPKIQRIKAITNAGFKVIQLIHRHGMNESTALEVEAALMQAYPGLTNKAGGAGTGDYGVMHVRQIIERYSAQEADFKDYKLILISVNVSTNERKNLYEATRYAWKINLSHANKAQYILSIVYGLIRGVYIVENNWLPATPENFPGYEGSSGRYGFKGKEAPENIKEQFIGKRVPEKYTKRGAANPIKYTYK